MNGSYGRADFRVKGFSAGSVELRGVHALPALGPTLAFNMVIRMLDLVGKEQWGGNRPELKGYELRDFRGEVLLKGGVLHIGTLEWTGSRSKISSTDYEHESQVALRLTLDSERFERLEELRRGAPLELLFRFWPTIETESSAVEATIEELRATIPREAWAEVLKSLRQQHIDIVEVAFHTAYSERFHAALRELDGAQEYIDRGDFAAAIVRCRKSLEMVAAGTRAEMPDAKSIGDVLAATVGPQRARVYAAALKSVKDLGNIELHEVIEHGYSRTEAVFALRTSVSLLQLYGSLLSDRRTRPAHPVAEG